MALDVYDLILVLIAFLSELIGTISGFGSSTFFVPLAVFFEDFKLVLALTSLLHCFGNFSRILVFYKSLDRKIFIKLVLPFLILTLIGSILTLSFEPRVMTLTLGGFLIFISIFMGRLKKTEAPNAITYLLTSMSGFFTGLVGTGGALRGAALGTLSLSKETFIVTSASIDLGGDILRASVYLWNGYMDWTHWFYIPLLMVSAYMGTQIGKKILHHFSKEQFEKIVRVFIFLSGLLLLIK